MDLVGIKVKITLKDDGKAQYPDWSQTSFRQANPNYKIGKFGGWHYDKCGHTKSDVGSPLGVQYGMLLVEQAFADEAVTVFPNLVTKMTAAEVEDFWNNKAYAHLPENKHNMDVLNGLKLEYDMKVILNQDTASIKAKIAKALDPVDVEPGVSQDRNKVLSTALVDAGVTVVDAK
jgi:hypothetical protein